MTVNARGKKKHVLSSATLGLVKYYYQVLCGGVSNGLLDTGNVNKINISEFSGAGEEEDEPQALSSSLDHLATRFYVYIYAGSQ